MQTNSGAPAQRVAVARSGGATVDPPHGNRARHCALGARGTRPLWAGEEVHVAEVPPLCAGVCAAARRRCAPMGADAPARHGGACPASGARLSCPARGGRARAAPTPTPVRTGPRPRPRRRGRSAHPPARARRLPTPGGGRDDVIHPGAAAVAAAARAVPAATCRPEGSSPAPHKERTARASWSSAGRRGSRGGRRSSWLRGASGGGAAAAAAVLSATPVG